MQQAVARQHVEHDRGELRSAAALEEEDGVCRGHGELRADLRLDASEVGGELLGAVRDFGDAHARALEVEEPLGGLLKDLDGERRGACAKVGDAAVGHCVGGG